MTQPNVMIGSNLHAKISDFGLAMGYVLNADDASSSSSSNSGHTRGVGTPRYMAPEVLCVSGSELEVTGKYDEKCDVYSFGLLLWEVAHKEIPWAAQETKTRG